MDTAKHPTIQRKAPITNVLRLRPPDLELSLLISKQLREGLKVHQSKLIVFALFFLLMDPAFE